MNQTDSANSETPDPTGIQFSLVAGGPFHNVLQRLGLTGPDRLPSREAAMIIPGFRFLQIPLFTPATWWRSGS
jgi:hypothetical protein